MGSAMTPLADAGRRWLLPAFLAVLLCAPWLPGRWEEAGRVALEVTLQATLPGVAELHGDVGSGFVGHAGTRAAVRAGEATETVRLAVPAGALRALRLRLSDRPASVSVLQARLVGADGAALLPVPPSAWQAAAGVATLRVKGNTLEVEPTETAAEVALGVVFRTPFAPAPGGAGKIASVLLLVLPVWLALLIALALLERAAGRAGSGATGGGDATGLRLPRAGWWSRRPRLALAAVAFAATLASAYPVVFLGGSFVAAGSGSKLLYDRFPTVPESTVANGVEVRGVDSGALLWQHLPATEVQRRALAAGEIPFWNRYNAAGVDLLAQGQSMLGDPLHALVLAAGGESWAWDLRFLAARFLFIWGMALLAWRASRSLGAAAWVGAASGFIGFYVYRVIHPATFTLGYAPWILLGWWWAADAVGGRRRDRFAALVSLAAASLCVVFSGTVKEAVVLSVVLHAAGLAVFLAECPRGRRLAVSAPLLTVAAAGLLAAPWWLTFLDALRRSATGYDVPTVFQLPPGLLLGFFDELFHRPLQPGARVSNPSANFVVLVGLLGCAVTWRALRPRAGVVALAWSLVPVAALTFGVVPAAWIVAVPLLGGVSHWDNCGSLALIVLTGPLAACGWAALAARLRGPSAAADFRGVAAGMAILLLLWLGTVQAVPKVLPGVEGGARPLLADPAAVPAFVWVSVFLLPLVALGGLALLRAAAVGRVTVPTAVLGLAACGAVLLWRHGVQPGGVAWPEYVVTVAPRERLDAPSAALLALSRDADGVPSRVAGVQGVLTPGWNARLGLEGLSGPDALMNRRYRELTEALGLPRFLEWRLILEAETLPRLRPAWAMLGTRYLLDDGSGRAALAPLLPTVARADLDVYRDATAWPRAFFVDSVVPHDGVKALAARVLASVGGPFAGVDEAELRRPEWRDLAPPRTQTSAPARPARRVDLLPNATRVWIDAPGAGLAVLHETWLDGDLHVTRNGEPATLLRVNHAFAAVAIPAAGEWELEFRHRPRTWSLALRLAALGALLGTVTLVVWGLRRSPAAAR